MIGGQVIYRGVVKHLSNVEKQSRWATIVSLTAVAGHVKSEEIKALSRHLKSPTPFTKNAYRVQRATKARMIASVYAAPIQDKYLSAQVYGGNTKGHVPGKKQNLNAYGNLPRRATKRKKTFNATIGGLFGTWQNKGKGKNRKLILVAHYPKSRKYTKRLPFFRVAHDTVGKRFRDIYRDEFKKALRSAR